MGAPHKELYPCSYWLFCARRWSAVCLPFSFVCFSRAPRVDGLLNALFFRLSISFSMFIIPNAIRVPMFMRFCANRPILPLKTPFIS